MVAADANSATETSSRAVAPSGASSADDPRFRVVVGGGPVGYRALLQAEFEEKSDKVLRILTAKDEAISRLEAELAKSSQELSAALTAASKAAEELRCEADEHRATKAKLSDAMRQGDEQAAELADLRRSLAAAAQAQTHVAHDSTESDHVRRAGASEQIEVLLAEIDRLQEAARRQQEVAAGENDVSQMPPVHGGGGAGLWERRVNAAVASQLSEFESSLADAEARASRLDRLARSREAQLKDAEDASRRCRSGPHPRLLQRDYLSTPYYAR